MSVKEIATQLFSCEFYEFFLNNYFAENFPATASEYTSIFSDAFEQVIFCEVISSGTSLAVKILCIYGFKEVKIILKNDKFQLNIAFVYLPDNHNHADVKTCNILFLPHFCNI